MLKRKFHYFTADGSGNATYDLSTHRTMVTNANGYVKPGWYRLRWVNCPANSDITLGWRHASYKDNTFVPWGNHTDTSLFSFTEAIVFMGLPREVLRITLASGTADAEHGFWLEHVNDLYTGAEHYGHGGSPNSPDLIDVRTQIGTGFGGGGTDDNKIGI